MHLLQLSHELASVITVLIAFSKVLLLYYIIINGHLACTLYERLIEGCKLLNIVMYIMINPHPEVFIYCYNPEGAERTR